MENRVEDVTEKIYRYASIGKFWVAIITIFVSFQGRKDKIHKGKDDRYQNTLGSKTFICCHEKGVICNTMLICYKKTGFQKTKQN